MGGGSVCCIHLLQRDSGARYCGTAVLNFPDRIEIEIGIGIGIGIAIDPSRIG
jgi:hypothetical protein